MPYSTEAPLLENTDRSGASLSGKERFHLPFDTRDSYNGAPLFTFQSTKSKDSKIFCKSCCISISTIESYQIWSFCCFKFLNTQILVSSMISSVFEWITKSYWHQSLFKNGVKEVCAKEPRHCFPNGQQVLKTVTKRLRTYHALSTKRIVSIEQIGSRF
jgi:hypothetical protein